MIESLKQMDQMDQMDWLLENSRSVILLYSFVCESKFYQDTKPNCATKLPVIVENGLLHFHPAVLKCKLNIIYHFILPDENPRKSMKKICSIKIKINL